MPVSVYWQDATMRIMRYDIQGNWTWDELYAAYHKAADMQKDAFQQIDIIIDISNTGRLPLNILSHVRTFADKIPSDVKLIIVVTTNQFLLMLHEAGGRFYPNIKRYFRITPTVEAAQQVIQESQED